jgi:hypothetical protein
MNFLKNIGMKEYFHFVNILIKGEQVNNSQFLKRIKKFIHVGNFVMAKEKLKQKPNMLWKLSAAERNRLWNG